MWLAGGEEGAEEKWGVGAALEAWAMQTGRNMMGGWGSVSAETAAREATRLLEETATGWERREMETVEAEQQTSNGQKEDLLKWLAGQMLSTGSWPGAGAWAGAGTPCHTDSQKVDLAIVGD